MNISASESQLNRSKTVSNNQLKKNIARERQIASDEKVKVQTM